MLREQGMNMERPEERLRSQIPVGRVAMSPLDLASLQTLF